MVDLSVVNLVSKFKDALIKLPPHKYLVKLSYGYKQYFFMTIDLES